MHLLAMSLKSAPLSIQVMHVEIVHFLSIYSDPYKVNFLTTTPLKIEYTVGSKHRPVLFLHLEHKVVFNSFLLREEQALKEKSLFSIFFDIFLIFYNCLKWCQQVSRIVLNDFVVHLTYLTPAFYTNYWMDLKNKLSWATTLWADLNNFLWVNPSGNCGNTGRFPISCCFPRQIFFCFLKIYLILKTGIVFNGPNGPPLVT